MSIFPFIDEIGEVQAMPVSLPVPKEYAWDFQRGDFIREDGKIVAVEGREAIKLWIYKALHTTRYRWPVYSWNYGSELETLIGTSYSHAATQSEAKRYVGECLLVNPYIKGIKDLHTSFQEEKLNITFTAVTDYGEVMIHV